MAGKPGFETRCIVTWGVLGTSLVVLGYTLAWLFSAREPVTYLLALVLSNTSRNSPLSIALFWVISLVPALWLSPSPTSTGVTANPGDNGDVKRRTEFRVVGLRVRQITARKWYHLLAVILFSPGIILQPRFQALALIIALVLFCCVECVRLARLWPLADLLQAYLSRYLDSREKGPLIVSHTYLLLGITLPLLLSLLLLESSKPMSSSTPTWASSLVSDHLLGSPDSGAHAVLGLSGVISLGIGDTFASVVGINIGRRFLPGIPGTKKSLEGTLGAFGSMCAFSYAAVYLTRQLVPVTITIIVTLTSFLTAVLEAVTDQMDNLYLPAYFFTWSLLGMVVMGAS
uniref:dolichol kinase n=1 Tax=Lotharella oceanica TaxID=641309 RepID=A0A7S2TXL3_9EUKA